jgi:hypothetical protein
MNARVTIKAQLRHFLASAAFGVKKLATRLRLEAIGLRACRNTTEENDKNRGQGRKHLL